MKGIFGGAAVMIFVASGLIGCETSDPTEMLDPDVPTGELSEMLEPDVEMEDPSAPAPSDEPIDREDAPAEEPVQDPGVDDEELLEAGAVVAWGSDEHGQLTVSGDLSDLKSIAAGNRHNLALKEDGTVVAWGSDTSGQSTVPDDLSDVQAIAAGGSSTLAHNLVLKEEVTVDGIEFDIVWSSDNTDVIEDDGTVHRPGLGEEDVDVEMTATVTSTEGHEFVLIFTVTVLAVAEGMTVDEIWAAGYTEATAVVATGVVAALTDGGYLLQDYDSAMMISVRDGTNVVEVGDEILLSGEFYIAFGIYYIGSVVDVEILSSGESVNYTTANATLIDWEGYATGDFNTGQLVEFDGFWARFASTADTSYLRIFHETSMYGDQDYAGSYIGFQNGANALNLPEPLADIFSDAVDAGVGSGGADTDYGHVTIYAFLYHSSAAYQKYIIIHMDHIDFGD